MSTTTTKTDKTYNRLLRVIDKHTNPPNKPLPAAARRSSIGVTLTTSIGTPPHEFNKAIETAVQDKEDIKRVYDAEDNERLLLNDEPSLRALLAALNQAPDKYAVGKDTVAQWIGEVSGDE